MKNAITRLLLLFVTLGVCAQQGINYKALIKDGGGTVVASQTIDVKFTIIADTGPTNVYVETHTGATTDANGILILTIGGGTPDSGVFADIDWGSDMHSLKVEIDIEQDASFIDMGTTQFMEVPYAITAKSVGEIDQSYIAALEARIEALEPAARGDVRAGGIVFWVDPADNTHGLVCALDDQSSGIQWWNGSYVITSATGTAIGTGSSNTDAIISVQGPVATSYAAGLARAYTGGGFTDWFLPSKDELNQMYINKAVINASAIANGGAAIANYYWSSTEANNFFAWGQDVNVGNQYFDNKFTTNYVRAVRAF